MAQPRGIVDEDGVADIHDLLDVLHEIATNSPKNSTSRPVDRADEYNDGNFDCLEEGIRQCGSVWCALQAEAENCRELNAHFLSQMRQVQERSEKQFAESTVLLQRLSSARASLSERLRLLANFSDAARTSINALVDESEQLREQISSGVLGMLTKNSDISVGISCLSVSQEAITEELSAAHESQARLQCELHKERLATSDNALSTQGIGRKIPREFVDTGALTTSSAVAASSSVAAADVQAGDFTTASNEVERLLVALAKVDECRRKATTTETSAGAKLEVAKVELEALQERWKELRGDSPMQTELERVRMVELRNLEDEVADMCEALRDAERCALDRRDLYQSEKEVHSQELKRIALENDRLFAEFSAGNGICFRRPSRRNTPRRNTPHPGNQLP